MTIVSHTLEALYPLGSFFCARTTRDVMAWNVDNPDKLPHYRLDATPAQLLGFAGGMAFIAHEAAATQLAQDFALHCGLPGATNLITYKSEAEAESLALKLMSKGGKLVYNFGTLPALKNSDGLLTDTSDYLHLNAKQNRSQFVSPENLPDMHELRASEVVEFLDAHEGQGFFIKLAGPVSTGGGAGVWHCKGNDSRRLAVDAIARRLEPDALLIAETDCAPVNSWCAGVSILEDKILFLGASKQVFYSPARQAGNEFSGEPPEAVKKLALEIAARAQSGGYRGIAGFDIGELANKAPVVFDLNFRPNSSTGLLLAGKGAMQKTGLPLARTFYLRHDGPLAELLDAVSHEADGGRIIPGSMFDALCYGKTLNDAATRSCLDGWLLAEDSDEVASFAKVVAGRLAS